MFRPTAHLRIVVLAIALAGCAAPERAPEPPRTDLIEVSEPRGVTVAMLGATGMVGGYVLDEALSRGYNVRVLARTPAKLDDYAQAFPDRISIVQGDALVYEDIVALLKGSDAVVSALGPVKADGKAAKTLNTTATEHVLLAMTGEGIDRYVLVAGAAVVMPGDKRSFTGSMIRQSALLVLRSAVKDKQAEYDRLAASDAAWTFVRPPRILDESYEKPPIASLETPSSWSLRAGELAVFLLDQLETDEYVREGPFLYSK